MASRENAHGIILSVNENYPSYTNKETGLEIGSRVEPIQCFKSWLT